MYQSQARSRAVGRALFMQRQPTKHPQSSTHHRVDIESHASHSQFFFKSRQSKTIFLGALTSLLIPVLSGCGVTFNKAAGAKASFSSTSGASLSDVSCGTQSLNGAQSKACSVYLSSAAETSTVVTLKSSNSVLQVPTEVTVLPGATSTGFNAVSSNVKSPVSVTITATSGRISQTSAITLYPGTPGALSSISCGAQSITASTTKACSVYLSGAAAGATTVSLSSSSDALQVPSTLTIAAGATTTGFNATASAAASSQSVTLTATAGGNSQSTVIQLLGAGAQAAGQHKVQLNWQPPASGSVAGYRVYRMTDGSSRYSALTSSVSKTSYVDSSVQSGLTYDYVVTSVDGKGAESSYSAPTTVTIP